MNRTPRLVWSLCALGLWACSDVPEDGVVLAPPTMPERTAAQDEAVRALLMDVVEARACEAIDDMFLPLPEEAAPEGEQPRAIGRLWASDCRVERDGDHLAMHLGGRAWQWIDRASAGPFGTSFRVRGYVRFEAAVELDAEIDVRYDEREHRAIVSLTPRAPARARVTAIGSVPVSADGSWSGVLGGLGGLLGAPVEGRAIPMVEAQGAAMVRDRLREGATVVFDLCTGQLDGALGALDDGRAPPSRPYTQGDARWLDNARTILRPGGLDFSGPWTSDGEALSFDVDLEAGGPAYVAVVCRREADSMASSYLAGGPGHPAEVLAQRTLQDGARFSTRIDAARCDAPVLSVRSDSRDTVVYRYRVAREGAPAEALVRCARE